MTSLTLVVVTFGSNELKPSREIWLFYYLLLKRKKRKKESTRDSGKDERKWRATLIFHQGKPDWK